MNIIAYLIRSVLKLNELLVAIEVAILLLGDFILQHTTIECLIHLFNLLGTKWTLPFVLHKGIIRTQHIRNTIAGVAFADMLKEIVVRILNSNKVALHGREL